MKIRSSEQWQRIDSVFSGALPLPPDAQRVYLDKSCASDPDLRAEVERLLAASAEAGDFLEVLDAGQAAKLLQNSPETAGWIGRYKVIRKIGSGGMGVVYLAEDSALERRIAVKLLPPWLDASSSANRKLLDEARAASAIDHPNIATVYEIAETDDGRLFISMGYYEGETLRDLIEREKIDVEVALDIAVQTARGLSAAHRKGIIHRDIKPENLLLTSDSLVKIVDFGLARAAQQPITGTGKAIGTAAYMSPEQTFASKLDVRTDLWSLGVVLFEMIAGERPFGGGTHEAVMLSIRTDAPAVNDTFEREVPPAVRAIIMRCLEKDPDSRYQTADDLARDLESARRATQSGAITELRTSPADDGRPRGLWNRNFLIGAAAITVAGAVGFAAVWQGSTTPAKQTASSTDQSSPLLPTDIRNSLAVLPFADMSPAADHEYLSDGITEELIHALGSVEKLRVVARSSAFQFKGKEVDVREAGARLGVAHILEGSVRSSGDRLRITVRLADAKQGYEIWSQVFDRKADDVLAIQSEIAGAVVRSLRIQLDANQPARVTRGLNADAYELYLKGRHLFNQRTDLDQAIQYFRASLAKDSAFAPAWTGLGKSWLVLPVYSQVTTVQARDSAEPAIRKALALDSTLAEAHAALGSLLADNWRWAESEPHFRRALTLNLGDPITRQWYGEMLVNTGRFTEGIAQLTVAQQLDPLTGVIPSNLGWALHSAGRQQEAIAAFRTAIDFNPRFAYAHVGMGSSLVELGRFAEAVTAYEEAVRITKGQLNTRAYLARGYAVVGRRPEAEKIFSEIKKSVEDGRGSAYSAAMVALSLGLEDQAVRWLELGYQRREISMVHVKISPIFKTIRSNARVVALLKNMGL